jgi:hypothetical protein
VYSKRTMPLTAYVAWSRASSARNQRALSRIGKERNAALREELGERCVGEDVPSALPPVASALRRIARVIETAAETGSSLPLAIAS